MSQEVIHAILIVLTITFSFLFTKTPLAVYDLHLSAFLIVLLTLYKRITKQDDHRRLAESLVFTFIITTIVQTSGGSSSPFFFLFYFLLFSLSLLLEPLIAGTTSFTLIIAFLSSSQIAEPASLLPLLSLLFITPFALFLGREQKKLQKVEKSTFLFHSLVLKNHIKTIKETAENFLGDHDLDTIKKQATRMEKLIDEYKNSS